MNIIYPKYIENILSFLENNGFEAYIVGGSLRDIILGNTPNDFDVTTSALPDQTLDIFRSAGYSVIPTGIKHGTVTVMSEGFGAEVTTFRVDGEYKDARHPENVTFARNIAEDLSRRDFTVNAIAYSPKKGLVDLFGGEEDIKKRIIRCVGDPEKRFSEDALRILRAFRFMSKLGFDIDGDTLRGAEEMRDGLKKVSRERIYSELRGLLLGKNAGQTLWLMLGCSILESIFDGYKPEYLPDAECINGLSQSFSLRLAAIFARAPYAERERWIASLKMSNEEKARVKKLLETKNVKPELSLYGARRFCVRYGGLSELAVELLRLEGFDTSELCGLLAASARQSFPRCIKELKIDGNDLALIGINRGHEMGDILEELFDAALYDPSLNTKEKLAELALKIKEKRI